MDTFSQLLLVAAITSSYAEMEYDKSKWIDPTDMIRDYSKQMKDMVMVSFHCHRNGYGLGSIRQLCLLLYIFDLCSLRLRIFVVHANESFDVDGFRITSKKCTQISKLLCVRLKLIVKKKNLTFAYY